MTRVAVFADLLQANGISTVAADGIVQTVRASGATYEIVWGPNATQQHRDDAEALLASFNKSPRRPKSTDTLVNELEQWIGNSVPQLRRASAYALAIRLQSIPDLLKNEPGAPVGDEPV